MMSNMNSPIVNLLENKIDQNLDLIKDYLNTKGKLFPATIYNSVDLRHSGFKIAPVDTNCFPAGFNNVKEDYLKLAQSQAQRHIASHFNINTIKNITIIAENHTRNTQYLASLNALLKIFQFDGIKTYICSFNEEIDGYITLQDANFEEIKIHKINKIDGQIIIDNNKIDLAILNNDLTKNYPDFFDQISTPIIPNPRIGWYNRSKFNHFEIYSSLCIELCQILGIDPWLISTIQSHLSNVNFKERVGLDLLAIQVDNILSQIQEKFNQYSIKDQPFCYIKADSGTYGMAVTQVFDSQEVMNFNKKARNKMNMLKENKKNSSVKIQEGIPSIDNIDNQTSEPLIYMVSGEVVAYLSRSHGQKDQVSSLNSPGAQFFNIDQITNMNLGGEVDSVKKAYWLVSKLASLSCAIEINNLN